MKKFSELMEDIKGKWSLEAKDDVSQKKSGMLGVYKHSGEHAHLHSWIMKHDRDDEYSDIPQSVNRKDDKFYIHHSQSRKMIHPTGFDTAQAAFRHIKKS